MLHVLHRRLSVVLVLVLLSAFGTAVPGLAQEEQTSHRPELKLERIHPDSDRLATSSEGIDRGHGPLTANPEAVAAAKAAQPSGASADAGTAELTPAAASPAPMTIAGWNGVHGLATTPPNATGAIGLTRYIEATDDGVAIYNRTGQVIAKGELGDWWGTDEMPYGAQVIWDATTRRFYNTGTIANRDIESYLMFGFSTTASPRNLTTDWCQYRFAYGGGYIPDFAMLGDSRDFAIIGVNAYDSTSLDWIGSDIVAISKPPAGNTCPDEYTFLMDSVWDIEVGGEQHFSPVPANEIDGNGTGWVVSQPLTLPASSIGLFKVTRNPDGTPNIQTSGVSIPVEDYTYPLDAPQKDSSYPLYTWDARFTQAVAAVDPQRGNALRIWTQHTVDGGAGARVRWYEIDPMTASVVQTAHIGNRNLYVFNGSISPDRVVKGATRAFGSNMVISFTTSSATTYPRIQMVSKRGANSISRWVTVKSSYGPSVDDSCDYYKVCLWGSFASATPDPMADPLGATGTVWLTNQWTADGDKSGAPNPSWRTWNWAVIP